MPVDVLSTSDLTNQGGVNSQDELRTVIPSFNVNTQPISDASTVVRPAMLRNLVPDHTLVLVNGKRRHRCETVNEFLWRHPAYLTGAWERPAVIKPKPCPFPPIFQTTGSNFA